jgi:DNA-binding transcriptional LysR family regulator
MRYTLRQLEVFVAVCRSESVSRAAEILSLSQSATSTALGELERQFDTQLFDRVGKKLQLNELGRVLLPKASELLGRANEIQALLEGKEALGSLHVGATLTIGNYLATLIIGRFLQRYPGSRVKLEVHNTATVVNQVAHFELDLGLIEGGCHHPDLVVTRWVDDELVIFCAPNHPLAQLDQVTLEDLLHQPWILREAGSGTRETFDHAMRHVMSQLDIRLELEHTEAIKRAVEAGLGVGCISRLALREAFRRGSLVPIEVPGLDFSRSFHFLWHKEKYQTAGIRRFLELCRSLTAGAKRSDEIELPYIP